MEMDMNTKTTTPATKTAKPVANFKIVKGKGKRAAAGNGKPKSRPPDTRRAASRPSRTALTRTPPTIYGPDEEDEALERLAEGSVVGIVRISWMVVAKHTTRTRRRT